MRPTKLRQALGGKAYAGLLACKADAGLSTARGLPAPLSLDGADMRVVRVLSTCGLPTLV